MKAAAVLSPTADSATMLAAEATKLSTIGVLRPAASASFPLK